MTPPPDPSSYLDQSSGAYLRAQLDAMKNGTYASLVGAEHTQAWDADQLGLQRQINDLAGQLGADVDPAILTGGDNFESLSLEQIRDLTYEIKPDVVHAVSEAWGKIGSGLRDATRTLSDGLKKEIAEGWQGMAAGKAAKALGDFLQTSDSIGKSATLVGMKVAFAQRGSDETFRMLGPVLSAVAPVSGALVQNPGLPNLAPAAPASGPQLPILAEQQGQDSKKDEAKQACLQVLRNVYAPGIRGGDQGVPVIPPVQPVANPAGPPNLGPGPSGPGTPNLGGGNQPSPGGDDSNSGTPNGDPNTGNDGGANSNPGSTTSPGTRPSAVDGTGLNQQGTGGSTLPTAASTTAAGFDPSGGLGGGSSTSGFGGGAAGHGFGGGSSSSGGGVPRSGGPGVSVPGKPLAEPVAPLGLRSPGQAGAPGTPGMAPGMGGRGGGKSEEDKERGSSELLRGRHLEEWIDDGRRVMPAYGAIGENPPQEGQSDPRPPHTPTSDTPDRSRAPGEYR
ncbi:hypothetical protein J2W56_005905 [Nocardia kruczakiae]|uniref:PPE family protein n=1 Tax=Nocardia kruczakiae TaxID=261477 RepID=A0ABU1XP65_9NOCA|nr:hypothetical protein [Nocardia kruczakiae]MDR7172144.1 hypothetical protein [Nocardia kruczakiae]